MTSPRIAAIGAATVQAELPAPVVFGDWIMRTREYVVTRVSLDNGVHGWAFTLTRDGPVAEQIRSSLRPVYLGTTTEEVESTFRTAQARSFASNAAGIGLRALSVVDLAVWDARAKSEDRSISDCLGGSTRAMPATAIIGYPPVLMGPGEVEQQVRRLSAEGWRRFKAPIAETAEVSAARLRAARRVAPEAWIGCDAAWTFRDAKTAAEFVNGIGDVGLGWFEDVFPPGNAGIVAELRSLTATPIAMGDEQGGLYYPEALITANAVDVVRIDLTCMGGISGGRRIVEECLRANVAFAPHMFAHVHSRVFSAWGHSDVPIEWGDRWTGVDPYADSLEQPCIDHEGRMLPPKDAPGFGNLINRDWVTQNEYHDPDRILGL